MAGLVIRSSVTGTGSLEGLLSEEIEVIDFGPNPCRQCEENADLPEPLAPPLHLHCFPAGTVVSGPKPIGSIVRWYTGELVEITTARGHVLAATPNHPVLTPQGWVGAGLLNEGSQVFSCASSERLVVGDPDEYQQPALIEDVAGSLGEPGAVMTACVPVTPMDFHGDGEGSEVAVIRSNGLLRNGVDSALAEHVGQLLLSDASAETLFLPLEGASDIALNRLGAATSGSVSGLDVPAVLSRGPHGGAEPVRGSATAVVGQIDQKIISDRRTADSVILGESVDGLAGAVSTDQIVKVRRYPFSGHVYNLETRFGWYMADSILVHNCHCQLVKTTINELA